MKTESEPCIAGASSLKTSVMGAMHINTMSFQLKSLILAQEDYSAKDLSATHFGGAPEIMSPFAVFAGSFVTMIGTGIVGLPGTMKLCGGPIPGCIVVFLASLVGFFTCRCLADCVRITKKVTFEEIGALAIPNPYIGYLFNEFPLVLMCVMLNTAYLLVVVEILDSVFALFGIYLPPVVLNIIFTVVSTPICLLRSFEKLRASATFCTVSFGFISLVVIAKTVLFDGNLPAGSELLLNAKTTVSAGTVLITGLQLCSDFLNHFNVPSLYGQLEREHKRMSSLIFGASFFAIALLYMAISYLAAMKFGDYVQSDMLKFLAYVYGGNDRLILFTQLLMGACMCFKCPLTNFAVKSVLLGMMNLDVRTCTNAQNVIFTLISRIIPCILGIILPRLDLALQTAGATAGITVLMITPGIMSIVLRPGKWAKIEGYIYAITGTVMMVVGLSCIILRETGRL